jgi:hypothetical protein
MSEPQQPERGAVEQIARVHCPISGYSYVLRKPIERCHYDGQSWPCHTERLRDALAAAEAQVRQSEHDKNGALNAAGFLKATVEELENQLRDAEAQRARVERALEEIVGQAYIGPPIPPTWGPKEPLSDAERLYNRLCKVAAIGKKALAPPSAAPKGTDHD